MGTRRATPPAFAKSAIISDMEQNVAGDWTHPMVHAMGIATSCSSPAYAGRTIASRGQSSGRKERR